MDFYMLMFTLLLGSVHQATAVQECKADIVFVIDSSSSVNPKNFKIQMKFVESVVRGLQIDKGNVRIGLLTYSTSHRIHFHMNENPNKKSLIAAIRGVPYIFGSTNTQEGLTVLREEMFTYNNGDRPYVPNVAIVMTDGVSNINKDNTIPAAKAAQKDNIHVFAVGINLQDDSSELDGIASPPLSENRFVVSGFAALKAIRGKLFRRICKAARTKKLTPPPPPTTTRLPPPCTLRADIMFVVDASNSVGGPNFQKVLGFIVDLLHDARIDEGDVRVGLVSFSTEVNLHFYLNQFTSKDKLFEEIKKKKVPTATLR